MLTFIKKIVIHQKKDYLLLLSILTLIASFEFCFIAMYDHLSRLDLKIDWMTFRAIAFIPFLTLMIAVVLSVFVVKYFIQNKKHEFSMLLLFGRKPKDLFISLSDNSIWYHVFDCFFSRIHFRYLDYERYQYLSDPYSYKLYFPISFLKYIFLVYFLFNLYCDLYFSNKCSTVYGD